MEIKVDMRDVGTTLDIFAESVGETTEQATVRLAVGVARGLAEYTQPRTLKTKGKRKAKAAATMRRVVEPVEPKFFTALKRGRYKRIKIGLEWVEVDPRRMLESVQDVWDVVERNRDKATGKTRKLNPSEKYLCRRSVFNKVATKRERLWGVAKGSWIGAGQSAAKKQKGLDRISIGKNFLSWAQRHADKGQSVQVGEDHNTAIILGSRAKSLAGNGALSNGDIDRAIKNARRGMFKYYAARLRMMRRKS